MQETLKILDLVHVDDVAGEHWIVECRPDDINSCKCHNVRTKSNNSCLELSNEASLSEGNENRTIERGSNTETIGASNH